MLKVWGRTSSVNVQKVLWCCEELGLPYERVDAGGPFGGTDAPEYLSMNPNGLVPTVSDDGFALWESNSIVRYLVHRYGMGTLGAEDPMERALAEKWMDFQLGTLFPAFRAGFLGLTRTPPEERDPDAIAASLREPPGSWPSSTPTSKARSSSRARSLAWATWRSGQSCTAG